ncbi:hypothetical protein V1264_011397 [Littorina saxatilis]|uniref:Uncharacterized protein n=2 Tax=Littorina saxatilis TaxID=31220 RepID=A0AAN9GM99_9CAEN
MASTIFNSNGLGFALPKHAFFKESVNRIILKLQEAGFLEAWKQKWWKRSPECDSDGPFVSISRQLEVQSIGGILIMYATVIILSFLCMFAQLMFYSKGCVNSRKNCCKKGSPGEVASATSATADDEDVPERSSERH